MDGRNSYREEREVELSVELPLLNMRPSRFVAERIEAARLQARSIQNAYPHAKVALKWVKVTKVGSMKDVDVGVAMAQDALAAPYKATGGEAHEPHPIEVPRPAPGAWAR